MAKGSGYKVPYRRRREGKTDYKKRLNLLKSGKCRLVVRKSNRYVRTQLISYNPEGDKVVASAHSRELKQKFNWKFYSKNIPAAYLTGLLCGHRGKKEKIKEAVLDLGLYPPIKGSRLYAALKGALDAGLEIPHSQGVFPSEKRIKGKHISQHREVEIVKNFKKTKSKIEEKTQEN